MRRMPFPGRRGRRSLEKRFVHICPKATDYVLRIQEIFFPAAPEPSLHPYWRFLLLHAAFVLAVVPAPPPEAPYSLRMTPPSAESVRRLLSEDWAAFLLPHEYESGRHYWATTSSLSPTWPSATSAGSARTSCSRRCSRG
jgi:hypothetical protein